LKPFSLTPRLALRGGWATAATAAMATTISINVFFIVS